MRLSSMRCLRRWSQCVLNAHNLGSLPTSIARNEQLATTGKLDVDGSKSIIPLCIDPFVSQQVYWLTDGFTSRVHGDVNYLISRRWSSIPGPMKGDEGVSVHRLRKRDTPGTLSTSPTVVLIKCNAERC